MKLNINGIRHVRGTNRETNESYEFFELHVISDPVVSDFVGCECWNTRIYPQNVSFAACSGLKPGMSIDAEIVINNYKKGILRFSILS